MSLRSKTATSRIVGAMGHIMASRGPCRITIARQPVEMQIQKKVNGLPSDWRLPVWTSLFGVCSYFLKLAGWGPFSTGSLSGRDRKGPRLDV